MRGDVVKDAVVTKTGLVDHGGREDVGFTEGQVARMVADVLVAAEGIGFGKSRRAARHMGERLVVAEAAEEIVLLGKGLIETSVELGVKKTAHRLTDVVVAAIGVAGVGVRQGINLQHRLANAVKQPGWNLIAGDSLGLTSIGIGWDRIPRAIALEIDIGIGSWACGCANHVGVYDADARNRIAEGVVREIAADHGRGWHQARKGDAVELILLFAIDK